MLNVDFVLSQMDADSPIRKPSLPPISKKLFQSPMSDSPDENQYSPKFTKRSERNKQKRKRKQSLIPDSSEKIKKVYVQECDKDSYSPDVNVGMRKRVLISLFHNKEYSMDFDW